MIRTENRSAVLAYLDQYPIVTLNIRGIIGNAAAEIFVDDATAPRGVAVRAGDFIYCFTEQDDVLDDICGTLLRKPGQYGLGGVWRPLAEKLRQRFAVRWDEPCALYYLPPANLRRELIRHRTEPIRPEDAAVVDRYYTYRDSASLQAIAEAISRRPSAAVYAGGVLASWVLVHDDNSLGIMYTREEYRGRGYAVDTTVALAETLLAAGQIPFLHIRLDNRMSPGLAAKCGFVRYGFADWFGITVAE